MFDVSKSTSSLKSAFSKKSDYIKGMFTDKNMKVNPYLLNSLRVLLVLVIIALLCLGTPVSIAMALDNLLVRTGLVVALVFLALVDPVAAVLLIMVFCVMYYQKEKMRMHVNMMKQESFRGGLESYASIGEDSNSKMDSVDMDSTSMPVDYISADNANTITNNTTMIGQEEDTMTFNSSGPTQFDRIQSNVVGDEDSMNTEVRTWVDESGPQGMSYPSGYPLDSTSHMNGIVDGMAEF